MTKRPDPPQYFERSGTDPGLAVPSPMPEPRSDNRKKTGPFGEVDIASMTMVEHLAELRGRILTCVSALGLGFLVGFYYALPIINLLKDMAPSSVVFVQLAPGEVLMTSVRLAVYIGAALASPVILYHTLRFVMPGLAQREKPLVIWAVVGGALLFMLGVAFAYSMVVPQALGFLVDYGQTVARIQLSVSYYISFCAMLLLVVGGMFELPMLLFLLSFTGLVTSERLIREWRWAIVWIFITAAIVTPTQDPFTLGMVALPMIALYALSIIPIKLSGR